MDKIYAAIQLLESGGPVMIPLFILSVITIAIAIERGIYYKRNRKKSRILKGLPKAVTGRWLKKFANTLRLLFLELLRQDFKTPRQKNP